jgi:hypothetical protein
VRLHTLEGDVVLVVDAACRVDPFAQRGASAQAGAERDHRAEFQQRLGEVHLGNLAKVALIVVGEEDTALCAHAEPWQRGQLNQHRLQLFFETHVVQRDLENARHHLLALEITLDALFVVATPCQFVADLPRHAVEHRGHVLELAAAVDQHGGAWVPLSEPFHALLEGPDRHANETVEEVDHHTE